MDGSGAARIDVGASDDSDRPENATGPDSVDRLRLMRRVASIMFVTGGLTAATGVEITAQTDAARWAQGLCGAGFVLCGATIRALPAQRRLIQVGVLVGIALLGVLIAGSNPTGMASLFYLWPMVFAAYFCSPRFTAWCMAWSAISLGVSLAMNPYHELKVDTFVGTISSVGLMSVLVSAMTQREDRLRRQLAGLAATDSLTGLLNRRAFDGALATMLDQATAWREPFAMVMFDLDHFKQFNDRHGHPAGDEALRAFAAVLRSTARRGDAVGRFGGEEFSVLLAAADLAGAQSYVQRVAEAMADIDDELIRRLTTSAGISVYDQLVTADQLIARADEALYAAKAAGRARFAWSDGTAIRTGAGLAA